MKYSVIFIVDEENADFYQCVNTIGQIFAGRGESLEILLIANGTETFLERQMGKIDRRYYYWSHNSIYMHAASLLSKLTDDHTFEN